MRPGSDTGRGGRLVPPPASAPLAVSAVMNVAARVAYSGSPTARLSVQTMGDDRKKLSFPALSPAADRVGAFLHAGFFRGRVGNGTVAAPPCPRAGCAGAPAGAPPIRHSALAAASAHPRRGDAATRLLIHRPAHATRSVARGRIAGPRQPPPLGCISPGVSGAGRRMVDGPSRCRDCSRWSEDV